MHKAIIITISVCIIFGSCSSKKSKEETLGPPASAKAVRNIVKGARFNVEKAGIRIFSTDKEIQWLEPKEDKKFEKQAIDESKSLRIYFLNDTSCLVALKDKDYQGTYTIDEQAKEDEKPGMKLRISYVDEDFKFGDGPASKVTYTYIIEAVSNKSLLLQTPRSLNDKNIILLMNEYELKE
jgi:hypothetical protein